MHRSKDESATPKQHMLSKLPHNLYTLDSSRKSPNTNSHIHTHFTNISIQKLGSNTILGTPPPEIRHSEHSLPRADRVHLSRLRCGHHTALATYRKRINDIVNEVCTHCHTSTHSPTQIMTHCPTLTHIEAQHYISSSLYLWRSTVNCLLFPQGSILARPDKLGTINNDNNNSVQ